MAAPAVSRVRVQVGGAIGSSSWTCAVYFTCDDAAPPVQANFDTAASAALSQFSSDVWDDLKPVNQTDTTLISARVDFYQANSLASSGSGIATQAAEAGTASARGPASQAMCASLYSATATRRGRGRIYLPATGAIDGSPNTYGFSTTLASTIAGDVASWLGDMATVIGTGFGTPSAPVVQSLTAGATFAIQRVLVDTRPDRIEHREKPIVFSRFAATV